MGSLGVLTIRAWRRVARRDLTDWSRWGMGCSLFLHGLVVLAILLGLPHLLEPTPPAPIAEPMPVDILSQGAPAAAAEPGQTLRPDSDAADLQIAPSPLAPETSDRAFHKRKIPPDASALPLHSRITHPSRAPTRPAVPQNGQSVAGPGLTDGAASTGWRSTISVKDFLRAQVERHLEFSASTWGTANFVVSIHVVLEPDGAVRDAQIVDDPRYTDDKLFRSVADSARRAVLVASPLQLPPGRYETFHDVVLDINPRDVAQ